MTENEPCEMTKGGYGTDQPKLAGDCLCKPEMLITETLNAGRARADFNPPGKAANRLDEIK
jgi:hypothetical protein